MAKNFLTKEGYEKLLQELSLLKTEKLPQILERLREAIGQGDISENAEYETAMAEKDLAEARIAELEELLDNVEIIESQVSTGEIKYGSKVVVEDSKGQQSSWILVGTGEVDIAANKISFDSPVGTALKGKTIGEKVKVRSPRGRFELTIISIN